jgi:hypothetical protein
VYDWPGVGQPSEESLKVTASAERSSGDSDTPRPARSAASASHFAAGTSVGVPVGAAEETGPGVVVWNGGRALGVALLMDSPCGFVEGAHAARPSPAVTIAARASAITRVRMLSSSTRMPRC